jgi:tetratricopeptide (TPR) repeat protein
MFLALTRHILIIIIFFCSSLVHASAISNSDLDSIYRNFIEKIVGEDGDPSIYGLPAEGNFLDPAQFTERNYGFHIFKWQYERAYRLYLASMIKQRIEKGPFMPADDYFQYDLSTADSFLPGWSYYYGAGVTEEELRQIAMASKRYFQMIEDNSLVRHHPDFSAEERLRLITKSEEEAAASRHLYISLMKRAMRWLMKQPEDWKRYMNNVRFDLELVSSDILGKLSSESNLLKKMSLSVVEGTPYEQAAMECTETERQLEELQLDLSVELFALNGSFKELRQSKVFSDISLQMAKLDECIISTFSKFGDSKRDIFLINSMLTLGDALSRAHKRINYSNDLLFIDEVIQQAVKFKIAQGSPRDNTPNVYIEDNLHHIPLIQDAIKRLFSIRDEIIARKKAGGRDADINDLLVILDEEGSYGPPLFAGRLIGLASVTRELKVNRLLEAAKDRLHLGRLYMMEDKNSEAYEHFLATVTMAPRYWRGWQFLGRVSDILGMRYESSQAYRKVISLLDRCAEHPGPECDDVPQQNAEYGRIMFWAGYAHLRIVDYQNAAELLSRSVPFAPGNFQKAAAEWLAVSRYSVSGLQTAWDEYRRTFRGTPLPDYYEEPPDAGEFSRLTEPPAPFLKMIRSGLLDLSYFNEKEMRSFPAYLHAHHAARIEAEASKYGLSHEDTRELIVDLYVRLSLTGRTDMRIQPALSQHATEMAQKGEKAVDRRDYIAAEEHYRSAVMSDPWWLGGLLNLAKLELINWGHCGPGDTLNWMKKVMNKGVIPFDTHVMQVSMYPDMVREMESKLRNLYIKADKSGSGEIIGLCDKPGVVIIRPDRAVPPY